MRETCTSLAHTPPNLRRTATSPSGRRFGSMQRASQFELGQNEVLSPSAPMLAREVPRAGPHFLSRCPLNILPGMDWIVFSPQELESYTRSPVSRSRSTPIGRFAIHADCLLAGRICKRSQKKRAVRNVLLPPFHNSCGTIVQNSTETTKKIMKQRKCLVTDRQKL
jgi:hypothetical protein